MSQRRKKKSRSNPLARAFKRQAKQSALLTLMMESPPFRYVMLGMALVASLAAFYVAPLWNVAPPHLKSVRSSLYSMHQVSRHQAAALEAMQSGLAQQAHYQLISALRRNAYSLELHRMLFTNALAQVSLTQEEVLRLTERGDRLLALSLTNRADLDLLLTFHDHTGQNERSIRLLRGLDAPTKEDQFQLLQRLFEEEDFATYQTIRGSDSLKLTGLAGLLFYDAAVDAIVSKDDSVVEASERTLSAALSEAGAQGASARALLLEMASRLERLESFETAFQALKALGEDKPWHHARYWILLQQKGLEQRSRLEAAQYWPNLMQYQPHNLKDLWNLSNGYFAVGLQDRGLELIQKAADQFGLAPSYWVGLGQYLLRSARWDDAGSLAVSMRSQQAGVKGIKAFSYFLEGMAQVQQGRDFSANSAFSQLVEQGPLGNPSMALSMGQSMVEMHQSELALSFLLGQETQQEDPKTFYSLLYAAARGACNASELQRAHKALISAQADEAKDVWRSLECSLFTGQGLEDSAERILSDPSQLPKSAEHAVLWEAVALHLGRPELSQKVWDTFDAEDLDEVYRSLHRLSRFQKMLAATQWKEAQQELRSLDQTKLFSTQLARLEAFEAQLKAELPGS